MASRFFMDQSWTLLKGVTLIRAHILMSGTTPVLQKFSYPNNAPNSSAVGVYATASSSGGGTSWPSQYQQGAEGVRSVTRTAAGLWTLVLQDNYQRVLDIHGHQALAGGLSTIVAFGNNTTITSLATAGGSTVGIALLDSTAHAADPGDATNVTINILLQNASEP